MMSSTRLKRVFGPYYKQIAVGAVLVIGLVAGLGILKYSQDLRQKAAVSTGTATLTLSPSGNDLPAGQKATVDILFNSQTDSVDGVQIEAVVGGTVPSDIAFSPATVAGLNTIVQTFEPESSGSSNKKLVLAMLTSNPTQPYTTNSTQVKLGTLTFTAPASGSMTVTFNSTATLSTKNGTGADILKTPTNRTFNFVQAAATARLSLSNISPASPQIVGRAFTINVVVDSANQLISGVDAKIKYDPQVFTVNKVEKSTNSQFSSYPSLTNDAATGTISISANVGVTASPVPLNGSNLALATLTITPKVANAGSPINFVFTPGDRNDSNIIALVGSGQETNDILAAVTNATVVVNAAASPTPVASPTPTPSPTLPTPTPSPSLAPSPSPLGCNQACSSNSQCAANLACVSGVCRLASNPSSTTCSAASPSPSPVIPTPSPSPVPSPSPNLSLTVKLKFQGRNRTGANKALPVVISRQVAGSTTKTQVNLTTDANGETLMNLIQGNYLFLVKPQGYLAKKFGSTASPLSIAPNSSVLDFSNTTLLGGDFNGDGVINEVDYTLQFLNKFKTNDAMVDLDGSGEVNNLDFGIMRSNWGLTDDQL